LTAAFSATTSELEAAANDVSDNEPEVSDRGADELEDDESDGGPVVRRTHLRTIISDDEEDGEDSDTDGESEVDPNDGTDLRGDGDEGGHTDNEQVYL
jgi:hypothetical protein